MSVRKIPARIITICDQCGAEADNPEGPSAFDPPDWIQLRIRNGLGEALECCSFRCLANFGEKWAKEYGQ